MKTIFKFLFLVIVTTLVFLVVSSLLPYSRGFKEATKQDNPLSIIYVLLTVAWICLAITFIVKHSHWNSPRLIVALIFSLFFVYSFMAQIETFFFNSAFHNLTNPDIFFIMIANGVIIFAGVPLAVKLFGKRRKAPIENHDIRESLSSFSFSQLIIKLALIGICYLIVYFAFGYYVAWQIKDLRIFYSGNPDDNGFISVLTDNFHQKPAIYPFQFLRGVLFGLFVLPLVSMFKERPRVLLISLILVFLSLGISLVIPNFLFPDTVRWAHFREMISSMFVFAVIVWLIYKKGNVSNHFGP